MAKIIIIIEDIKNTKTGAIIRSRSVWDPPMTEESLTPEGKLDPKKCTVAQFLANDIGGFIESKVDLRLIDTGLPNNEEG